MSWTLVCKRTDLWCSVHIFHISCFNFHNKGKKWNVLRTKSVSLYRHAQRFCWAFEANQVGKYCVVILLHPQESPSCFDVNIKVIYWLLVRVWSTAISAHLILWNPFIKTYCVSPFRCWWQSLQDPSNQKDHKYMTGTGIVFSDLLKISENFIQGHFSFTWKLCRQDSL